MLRRDPTRNPIEQTAREQLQKLDEQDDDQEPPSQGGSGGGSAIGQYSKTNRRFGSTTDPDASLVRQGGLKSQLRYKLIEPSMTLTKSLLL